MPSHFENPFFTRRGVLTLAASAGFAGLGRLYAANPDFWNKKDPSDWSRDEIEQLTSKSPWAKEVTANIPESRGDYGGQGGGQSGGQGGPGGAPGGVWGGGPRIGGMPGMGIPGLGGGGTGGRRGGQQPVQTYRGTVRWESAKPVLEALKTQLPDSFADRYVLSVSGIPLPNSRRGSRDDDDTDSNSNSESTRDMLDRLKSVTSLDPKGKVEAQAGVVEQQTTAGLGTILFGFSKSILSLKPEDKEVTFSTQFGRVEVRTKFNLKDMLYRGELAL
jgi:hypothetical protein